ncbi:MAG: RagB/SusD family nutrient uptake outer membrane protein [Bacteroidota bacterium]
MRKNINKILVVLALSLGIQSCNYLDVVPENTATIDDAFTRPAEAYNFLYSLYSFMPKINDHLTYPQHWVNDETVIPWTWYDAYKMNIQPMSLSNPFFDYWGNPGGHSYNHFEGIRQAYTFLENIDRTPGFLPEEVNSMKGEAQFIIGYLHFMLMRQYGPTLIINQSIPLDAGEDEYYPHRKSIDEVTEFCLSKFDQAYDLLPDSRSKTDYGRITKPVVSAVKGRMLLYMASPLFNGNSDYASFTGKSGETLFPQTYDSEKWMKAIKASEIAIEDAENTGVALYNAEADVVDNYRYALVEPWNNELIWGYKQEWYWGWQRHSAPRVIDGGAVTAAGGNGPTLREVEMYYTENGLPIDEDPAFDYMGRFSVLPGDSTAVLHRMRETRFYSNIAFDRGIYKINGTEQTMYFRLNEHDGYDGVDRSNYTRSGYLIQKLVHPETMFTTTENTFIEYPWPALRLAEVYLNMAEALNEYAFGTRDKFGNDAVYYLDLVRERAGIPSVGDAWALSNSPGKPSSQDGLREIIQRERNIELAFEGHRMWDLRRWKQGDKLNTPVYGLNIEASSANEFYSKTKIEDRYFDVNKSYFWPINLNELQKNPNLVQNPGY